MLRPGIAVAALGGLVYASLLVFLGFSPEATDVGYMPTQPVPYSHALHVGQLGLDCRYCHTGVESAAHASIPPTQTCMNCHAKVRAESEKLIPVRESNATGMPVPWIRVHDLPDYVYFDHSAHVRRGVGCVSCHGRVDTMEVVYQAEPLSMGWCLDCHRNPERHLRPVEMVTRLDWVPEDDQLVLGARLREEHGIDPKETCNTCHR
ncbi:MAG: cytochrome c family protein [Thermoanaerobaculales bacterium]|nr:cytochrome c family protein [Thermoanaerobaculales bacterium]